MGAELTLPRRALSVEDFHRAGQAGLFRPEERLELIGGDVITMAPIGWPHSKVVTALTKAFTLQLGDRAIVLAQNPISLPPDNEPQPDIAILRAEYGSRMSHPGAADTLLVIEVADTTLERDRDVKIPLYGRSDIPEAWLFDLQNESVTVFRDCSPEGYRAKAAASRDAILSPGFDASVRIELAAVWRITGR